MRSFLQLAYDGSEYFGWQRQPAQISVQQVLEESLSKILRENISVVGAGRTDTGVHAKKMYAHFDSGEIKDKEQFLYSLNAVLPYSVAVNDVIQVKDDAHARFDALERTYQYYISLKKDPFLYQKAHFLFRFPDIDKMNEAAKLLFEFQDFECFSRSNTDVKTYLCDIKEAFWKKDEDRLIFTITADRFLRNMVRAIVGTLLEIGFGKKDAEDLKEIIESKNRSKAGASAPAAGLYLVDVKYPSELFSY